VAFVLATTLVVSLCGAVAGDPGGGRAGFGWLTGLWADLAQAATGAPQAPRQQTGRAGGPAKQVPASATDAGRGTGRPLGRAPGELPAYTRHTIAPKPVRAGGTGSGRFDAARSRRLPESSNASQDVFSNPDGSVSRRVYTGQVNRKQADGTWAPLDLALARRADGRLAPRSGDLALDVAPKGDAKDLVRLRTAAGQEVAFGLHGAKPVTAATDEDGATFAEVLPDTDLVETPTADGVKESIVLRERGTVNSWLFPLTLKGLTPKLAEDGGVDLLDARGAVVQQFARPMMWDSKVDLRSGDPATSYAVRYSLEPVEGGQALRVTADQDWLDDPARVFPVTVDPTLTTSTSTYVETNNSGSHKAEQTVKVGTYDGGTHKANSFLNFSTFYATYAGLRMTSVKLKIFMTWSSSCTAARPFYVAPVTQLYDWSTLSAFPGPTVGSSIGSLSVLSSAACNNTAANRSVGEWVTVPLNTDTFNSWSIGGTNIGLSLYAAFTDNNGWKQFDSANMGSLKPYLDVTYTPDVLPQVNAQYPPDNSEATTLTPELLAVGRDSDGWPKPLQYEFSLADTNGTKLAGSGRISRGSWVVPAGVLKWGKSYLWTVQSYDGYSYSANPQTYMLSTPVPQPQITSGLSQNNDDQGYEPSVGNYTTSETDAEVATVGPPLEVERSYNSLDPRTTEGFGAGWSSALDSRVTEQRDAAGAVRTVVITYPDGQDVAFGRNADGTFTPPQGRFSTFKTVSGGYALTDKDATTFTFTQALGTGAYGLTTIADASGRAEQFAYTSGQVTTVTAASGRKLTFTWTTPSGATSPHVTAVTTDPVTASDPNSALVWTYRYSGDQLTGACHPGTTTECTTYGYSDSTLYPQAVLGGGPSSYWRLGEAAGATRAASGVLANQGVDNATYNDVTLGEPGSLPGSAATAATFNGTSSNVAILNRLALGATYQSVGLRFRTSSPNGVLFSYQAGQLATGTTNGTYTPALYIGSDGKLRGEFWNGTTAPIASAAAVTDGQWHEAVLVGAGNTQTLYLDGVAVGTAAGQILATDASYVNVGGGFIGGGWPSQPYPGAVGTAMYFNGSISDVKFYDQALAAADVAALTRFSGPARVLSSVTRPSGAAYAAVGYDTVSGRVSQVTDEHGAVWKLNPPTVSGSSQVYAASVLGAGPHDYWRLAEPAAADAVNQVNVDMLTYQGGVTLGGAGRFSDSPAAAFDGTTGYAAPTGGLIQTGGKQSLSLWFKGSAQGVLFGHHQEPITNGTTSVNYVPMLYIGSDGKLRGEFYYGGGALTPFTSSARVDNNAWHNVVLSAGASNQAMYLDGVLVGTKAATVGYSTGGANYAELGTGYIGGSWPSNPKTVSGSNAALPWFYKGSIADFAYYRSELSAAQVTQQWAAATASDGPSPVTTVTVTDPAAKTIGYQYDTHNGGRLLAQTDALGNKTQFGYDTAGFLNSVIDPNGDVTTTGHDVRGNQVSQKTCQDRTLNQCSTVYLSYFPDSTSTTLSPDPRNDLVLSMRDGRSASATDNTYLTSYGYDAAGNQTTVTSPPVPGFSSGRTTTTSFTTAATAAVGGGTTPAGLPATVTSPGGAVTKLEYYARGDLARQTDAVGLVTSYTYDNLGRALTETQVSDTFPDGLTTTFSYDSVGQVRTRTEPPVANRVTGVTHTSKTTTSYNPNGDVLSETIEDLTGDDPSRMLSSTYDAKGRPATSTDAAGKVTTFTYDSYGNVASKTDPSGTRIEYVYDAEQRLLTTTLKGYTGDPVNPSSPVDLVLSSRAYDPSGRLATVTDSMGRLTRYTYTDNGLLSTVSRSLGSATYLNEINAYDAAGNLTSKLTNNATTITTYQVDAAGRTTAETADPGGLARTATYSYDPDDAVTLTKVTGAGSSAYQQISATYDKLGRPLSRTVSGSVEPSRQLTTTWTLDKRGLVVSEKDPRGNVTEVVNDEAGQPVVTTEPQVSVEVSGATATAARPVTKAGYDTFGERTDVLDPNGNRSVTEYDSSGRVVAETGPRYTPPGSSTPITPTTRNTYDDAGQLLTQTDPLGKVTSYVYDQLGGLATQTDPRGGVLRYTYDTNGEVLSVTDPTGARTEATYDFLGRPLTSSQIVRQPTAAVNTSVSTYANAGWLETSTTPAGAKTTWTRNSLGETTKVVDGAGVATTARYDFAGRRSAVVAADGTSQTTSYDDAGNAVAQSDLSSTGTVLRTTSAKYDDAGNLAQATDARGNTSTFSYDAGDNVVGQLQPVATGKSISTSFGYDAAGNRTRFTDGRGNPFWTTYNVWNLPESQIEPATTAFPDAADRTFSAVYDAAAQIVTVKQPGGVTVTNSYNETGDLTGSTGTGGEASTTARSFGYDLAGRLKSVSAPGGPDQFDYDDRGLLLSASGPSGASSFSYTNDGLMDSRTDASGTSSYTYDAGNRLKTVADAATGTTLNVAYNSVSQLDKITYGTGNVRSFGYDGLHRLSLDALKTSGGTTIASVGYGYDANDNITAKTTTGFTGAAANTYTYDAANRLSSWNNGSAAVLYDYDDSGNRTKVGSATYSYDARNQLTGDGTKTYTYSARGTLASVVSSAGTQLTAFDAFGQGINQSGRSYTYDGFGRVVTATGGGLDETTLAYSGMGNEVASDGTATYSRGPDAGLVGTKTSAGGVLNFTDQHDDVIGQFTAAGTALSASQSYDPLGAVKATTGLKGSLGFQSGWTDPQTKRVNMASRWYDPDSGVFISRDVSGQSPVPTSISANRFAYVNGNPLAGTDPTGMCSWYDMVCGVQTAASKVYHATTSALSSAKTGLSQFSSYASHYTSQAYHGAVKEVKKQVTKVQRKVTQIKKKVVDGYHHVKKKAKSFVAKGKQALSRQVTKAKNYGKEKLRQTGTLLKQAKAKVVKAKAQLGRGLSKLAASPVGKSVTRMTKNLGNQVKSAGHGVAAAARVVGHAAASSNRFLERHAATIASVATGIVVFAGCEAALGITTAGVGAVAGAAACGALAGAAAGAVGNLIQTSQDGTFTMKGLAAASLEGALTGAVTGAGGALAGRALSVAGGKAIAAIRGSSRTTQVVDDAASAAQSSGRGAPKPSLAKCGQSFSPETRVVMADGKRVPIAKLKRGQRVLASDPATGRTRARTVQAVMVNRDHDRYDLTVKTGTGKTAVVHTTAGHPIYSDTAKSWVKAGDLAAGTRLRALGTGVATLVSARPPTDPTGDMWDLTVEVDHDFFIETGDSAALVHNCGVGGVAESANSEAAMVAPVRASGTVGVDRNIAAMTLEAGGTRVSGIAVSGQAARNGMMPNVGAASNPQRFIPTSTGMNSRVYDAELKLLNYAANELGPSSGVAGTLRLHSELPICPSCSSVMRQFRESFPNINITVTTG
jgi:RHS repeat-associated protein